VKIIFVCTFAGQNRIKKGQVSRLILRLINVTNSAIIICGLNLKFRPTLTGQLFCHFDQFNAVLKKALSFVGLKDGYFKSHSFRIDGATFMFKQGYQIH
jgi:hypothetical protein